MISLSPNILLHTVPSAVSLRVKCPIVVHTVAEHELRWQALQYFYEWNKALFKVGHESQPESIYHNPELFPHVQEPWLYSYRLRGFENPGVSKQFGWVKHICACLNPNFANLNSFGDVLLKWMYCVLHLQHLYILHYMSRLGVRCNYEAGNYT